MKRPDSPSYDITEQKDHWDSIGYQKFVNGYMQ